MVIHFPKITALSFIVILIDIKLNFLTWNHWSHTKREIIDRARCGMEIYESK